MISINALSTNRFSQAERALIRRVAELMMIEYGIQDTDINVRIDLVSIRKAHLGNAQHFEFGHGECVVKLCSKKLAGKTKSLIDTIVHEMTHVKQYIKGELGFVRTDARWMGVWDGEKHVIYQPEKDMEKYKNLPWEKEAFQAETKYAHIGGKAIADINWDIIKHAKGKTLFMSLDGGVYRQWSEVKAKEITNASKIEMAGWITHVQLDWLDRHLDRISMGDLVIFDDNNEQPYRLVSVDQKDGKLALDY